MRRRTPLAFISIISLALVGLLATPAQAASFTASTEQELRDRIIEANGNSQADTITLIGTGFTLTQDLPPITESLAIVGPGSGVFTLDVDEFDSWVAFNALPPVSTRNVVLSGMRVVGVANSTRAVSIVDFDAELADLIVDGGIGHRGGNVVATDIVVEGTVGDTGIYVEVTGSETATLTRVSVAATEYEGISVDASGTSVVTMTDIEVQGAGLDGWDGLFADLSDSASLTVTDSEFSGNISDGIEVNANNTSTVLIDRVTANENGADGIDVDADDDSTATIRNSAAARNGDSGFESDFHGGSGSFANVTAEGNEGDGFDIEADQGAQIIVTNAVALDNDERGLMAEPDTVDSMITLIGGRAEGNRGDGLYLNVDEGTVISDGFVSRGNNDGGVRIDGYSGQATLLNAVVEGNNVMLTGARGGVHINAYDDGDGPLNVLIDRTTISGNGDAGVAGAVFDGSTVRIVNSTISGNSSDSGAAVSLLGDNDSDVTIAHSTITLNDSSLDSATAVGVEGMAATVTHTIIAENTGGAGSVDLAENNASLVVRYSLVGSADLGSLNAINAGTGNILGQPAGLGPLADNGGPTRTHLPLAGSPAIGAGNPAIVGAPATDQRGDARISGIIEIGSVEIQAPELAATGASESIASLVAGIVLLLVLGGSLVMVARRRSSESIAR